MFPSLSFVNTSEFYWIHMAPDMTSGMFPIQRYGSPSAWHRTQLSTVGKLCFLCDIQRETVECHYVRRYFHCAVLVGGSLLNILFTFLARVCSLI